MCELAEHIDRSLHHQQPRLWPDQHTTHWAGEELHVGTVAGCAECAAA